MSTYFGNNLEQTYIYDNKINVTVTNEGYSMVKKIKPYECKNLCEFGNGLSVTNDVSKPTY